MDEFFYREGDRSVGPLSAANLRSLVGRKRISPFTEIKKGDGKWVKAGRIKGLSEVFRNAAEDHKLFPDNNLSDTPEFSRVLQSPPEDSGSFTLPREGSSVLLPEWNGIEGKGIEENKGASAPMVGERLKTWRDRVRNLNDRRQRLRGLLDTVWLLVVSASIVIGGFVTLVLIAAISRSLTPPRIDMQDLPSHHAAHPKKWIADCEAFQETLVFADTTKVEKVIDRINPITLNRLEKEIKGHGWESFVLKKGNTFKLGDMKITNDSRNFFHKIESTSTGTRGRTGYILPGTWRPIEH